jgi:hypothetical protein
VTRGRTLVTVLVALAALAGACGDDDEPDVAPTTTTTGPGSPEPNPPGTVVSFHDATVGDCWNQTQTGDGTYEVVDCADWHDYEIHAVVSLAGDPDVGGATEYPGEGVLTDAGQRACEREFSDYVGRGYEESLVLTQPIPPSEDEWAAGSRDVVCSLFDSAGRTMGSFYRSFQ